VIVKNRSVIAHHPHGLLSSGHAGAFGCLLHGSELIIGAVLRLVVSLLTALPRLHHLCCVAILEGVVSRVKVRCGVAQASLFRTRL